jgi:PAS domain S-box-containing protein
MASSSAGGLGDFRRVERPIDTKPSSCPAVVAGRPRTIGVVSDPLEPYVRMAELLDSATNIVYCVKDAVSRYVAVNQAFAERVGRTNRREVIGKTAADLFPAERASRYDDQDFSVLRTGWAYRDELELITDRTGRAGWFITNKQPIRDDDGVIVGLVALSVDLHRGEIEGSEDVEAMALVAELARDHLTRTVEVGELAAIAGMSMSQLERRMRRTFGLSPGQYLLRVRVDEATRRLTDTDESLPSIAVNCGWYDQSAFTRQFTRLAGCTPGEFRSRRR